MMPIAMLARRPRNLSAVGGPSCAPVETTGDAQVQSRVEWLPRSTHAADTMRTPIKLVGAQLPEPRRAPTVGQQTDEILGGELGYSLERIAELREREIIE